jgi:hypothetical protein
MLDKALIPLALKLAYTLFVAVLIPKYWMAYSAWTFLFFCDVALFIGLCGLWLESPLLMSMTAVGITIPQLLWVADLLTGSRITGMTSYMFDPKLPIFVRALSLFHGWLPFVLLWGIWRLGYDRRALFAWTIVSTLILLTSFFLAPKPPAPADNPDQAVNINYVHGMSYQKPQEVMPPLVWLSIMIVAFPVVFYLPAHLAFRALIPQPAAIAKSVPDSGSLAD